MPDNPQVQESPLLLRASATTKLLGLNSPKSLYRWVQEGIIPAACVLRVGSSLFFKAEALRQWAANGAKLKERPR